MRTALFALLLAVSYAVNETTTSTTGGQQLNLDQLGGCKLRCRKLTFIGEGSVPVKPNWALISLSVDVSSQQLQGGQGSNTSTGASNTGGNSSEMQAAMKVRDEAKHRSEFILNYLKDLGTSDLKDLQAQEISFRPDYKLGDNGDREFVGYKATFGLSFKVKIDKFQQVLDQIVSDSGANRVDSIVFVADEDVEQQANIKAIELASSNAWKQAQAVTKVLGIQGNLKLLSVRDKIMPVKKLIRRFARRLQEFDDDDNIGNMRGMDMDWRDNDSMLQWLQGDQIVNALLTFQFDFEDGAISFKEVEPVQPIAFNDSMGGLLNKGGQNATQPITNTNQPTNTNLPQDTAQPTLVLPNNTAAMKPGETVAVQPVSTQPPP